MALSRPPAWDKFEQDERFKALTPDLKLQTLNNWATALETYGSTAGTFNAPGAREQFNSFLDTKRQEYQSQTEVGTIQGILNAAANAWDSSQQALKAVGGVTPEEAAEISKLEYNKQARNLAPGYRSYLEAEGLDAVKAFAVNPIEVTTNIVAEGLAGSVPALAAGVTTGLAGAAIGAPTGIGAPIGFLGGQVAGTFAGSLATEYGSKILQELQEAGMDIKDPNSIVSFFSNEELVNQAREKGLAKGIPVAAFDALSAGVGGRVASIVKAATKAPAGSLTRQAAESALTQALTRTPTRLAATELGIQATAGGLGEVAGSLVAGEPIEPKAVFAEVVGEVGPGAVEIATGRLTSRFNTEKAETKAAQDKKVSETLKVEQTLQENNAPLTAEALRNAAVGSLKQDSEAQRLRELTLQGEQVPVAPPKVPDQYTPESLAKLDDTQLATTEQFLNRVLETARVSRPETVRPIEAALQNAVAERNKRTGQPAAPAAAAAAVPAPATPTGAVAFAAREEARGARPPAATPGGLTFAPPEEREVPGLAAVSPTGLTPAQIVQTRETTFGLPKENTFRNFVESRMGQTSAAGVLKLLADNNVIPQGTQTLAEVPNPDQAIGWLTDNGFDRLGGRNIPAFLAEKQQRGETLTPFTPSAGLPLFQAAEGAAPAAAPAPAPTGLQSLTEEELDQEEMVQQRRSETTVDEVQLAQANQALQEINAERIRRAQPPAPVVPGGEVPAAAPAEAAPERPALSPRARQIQVDTGATDAAAELIAANSPISADQVRFDAKMPEGWTLVGDVYVPPTTAAAPAAPTEAAPAAPPDAAFARAQERLAQIRAEREQIQARMRAKLGQASMGADPELAFMAVELAVNYAKEGVVRFSDWTARVRRDFPDIWDNIKDYLQEAWNTARTQVPELQPIEERTGALPLAPAPAGERPQVAITPAGPTTPAAPTPVEGALPLAPAPEGERPQVQIAPPQRVEGIAPGTLAEYRQNLLDEARNAGVRTVRRSFEEIEADMKGKGWNGRKSLKRFVREVMDQANQDLQEGVATPAQVIPDSKEEATIYADTRKNQVVPSMATIISRLAAATGRTLKGLKEARTKIRTDKEVAGYVATLRSIQKNAETQLANDLGITNPESIRFTADLNDEMRIPNRVTTTVVNPGTLTNAADLVVESPDPNAAQQDVENTLMDNRSKVRAYLETLPNGSYEVRDGGGNVVGTITIARPEVVEQTPAQKQAAKNLPKLRSLLQQKSDLMEQIRVIKTRIDRGDAGRPLARGDFRTALETQLQSLQEKSDKLEIRIGKFLDTARQTVMKFAETATSPDPNPELLATPPSTEGSLADYASFTDVDGNEGLLFDAIEYLSGNLDTTLEDVFVNDSEITARQLDQGRTLIVPTELRERVAPGITFDTETGAVTSAVSAINGGTRVSAPGQLQAAAKEAQTILDTDFSPVPEELVNVADIVQGIIRNPATGEILRTEKPLTKDQVTQIEMADDLMSRYEANANVDEDRVINIARVIFARAVRDGKAVTPRRALDQAAKKLLERQRYRPQILSTEAPVGGTENVQLGQRLSVAGILEQFEGVQPEGFAEEGYADQPSPGRVDEGTRNMLDYDELIYRQTTLRHARLIAADPEINRGSEVYIKQHAREMLTLRRRLAKEGKLRGFTQEEISNFTMSVLRDLDRRPLSARGLTDSRGFYSTDPDSIVPSDIPATAEEKGRALRIIREVVSKFYPGIREVVVSNGKGRMHVDPALERSLFANPERVAEVIRGMDDGQATAFIRSLGLHEYYHLGLLRKVGVEGLQLIGDNLTDAQLNEAADIYYSQATFLNEDERVAAYDKFKADRVSAAIEYVTMLAERMKSGISVQEMPELTGLPQNVLQRILSAIKAIWRRLETHVRVSRNPALKEKLDNLFEGVRELDQLAYGESVYPDSEVEFREAPAEYADQVGRIFESYKADTRKSYEVRIPGNPKTNTTAANPETAVRQVVARYIRDNGSIIINGRRINSIPLANSLVAEQGPAIKFAKLTVPKAEQALAKVAAKPDANGQLTQGNFEFYSYSPDTRVRVGEIGPKKGGVWDNIKAIFTGRYSETRAKIGGFGSSGNFTPEQRDIRVRQAATINADVARAEFLVKKYQRVLKKLYKDPKDIPTDTLNTALGSTENKYTDDQYRQLQSAVDEETRAALVRQFMEENIDAAEAKIADAQAQLPTELVSVIRDMRDTISALSDKLLAGGYISEKLKPVVEANRNVYLHRSYMIFDNPTWKAMMENPEPGSEHERIVNAADRLFRLKAQADIAREIRNEGAKRGVDIGLDRSLKMAAADKDSIALRAHHMMVDYLSVADDRENRFLLTGTLPGQRKLDIIKERGQISKEIRELWGQIEDNETNFIKSVAKMSAFMATTDTARELLDVGIRDGYIWKAGRSPGSVPPAGFRPIYEPGTISDYNPLKDAYAPKDVRDAFRSLQDISRVEGWAKWFSGLTAWSMASKTVGNFPQGYVRNFLGNPLLIINGGFVEGSDLLNPLQMLRNAKLALRGALANTGLRYDEAIQTKRNEYILNGVIGDNVESGLFREMIESSMGEPGIPSLWKNTSGQKNLRARAKASTGAARRLFERMADIYQGVDDFWKIFAYEQEKKFQRRAHSDWDEAQIQREAANRVRNKMPTYSLSPEVTKAIRRTPFIAPFITWTSEIIRTGANTLAIAAEDIRVGKETNNPEMVKNGIRALTGTLASAALIPGAVATSKAIFGYDEEDDEAIRQFVPEYEKNDQLFYIGQRGDGKAAYINLSYLDPQQMRAETAIAFYRALRGERGVGDAFIDAASQMLQPVLSEQLFAAAVMDLARNRTAQGGTIWNEQDTPANITIAKLNHLSRALLPGVITGAGTRIYRAATGQVTGQGRSYDLSNELAGVAFGQRVAEVDAQTDLGNKVRAFLSNRSDATRLLTRVLNNRGTIDIADIPEAYDRANEAFQQLYQDMRNAYLSAIKLGVPKAQALRIVSGEGKERGLSERDRAAIISGNFPAFRLSPTTLDLTITSAPTREEGIARRQMYLQTIRERNAQNQ